MNAVVYKYMKNRTLLQDLASLKRAGSRFIGSTVNIKDYLENDYGELEYFGCMDCLLFK